MTAILRWLLRNIDPVDDAAAAAPAPAYPQAYPWFGVIEGDELEQGDILESCPVFLPPPDLDVHAERPVNATLQWKEQDLIVMSQSCDLVKGRRGVEDVLLCAIWKRSEFTGGHFLEKDSEMENARKGRFPAVHVLAASTIAGLEREVRVVDFQRVYSLPVGFLRRRAGMARRLRLLPPYREHLSQSFARFFMRVGLPIDIPSFTAKKK